MTSTNAYETLYNNMKTKFTVVSDSNEYTLGEYMSKKANANTNSKNLPAAKSEVQSNALSSIFSYVNEKLTVKKPPVREKVMRRFPLRTTAAAFLTGIVGCALMLTYGIFALNASNTTVPTVDTEDIVITEEIDERN